MYKINDILKDLEEQEIITAETEGSLDKILIQLQVQGGN